MGTQCTTASKDLTISIDKAAASCAAPPGRDGMGLERRMEVARHEDLAEGRIDTWSRKLRSANCSATKTCHALSTATEHDLRYKGTTPTTVHLYESDLNLQAKDVDSEVCSLDQELRRARESMTAAAPCASRLRSPRRC